MQDDHDVNSATTRAVTEKLMAYWSVQDVEQVVALHAEDAVSVVHLDHPEVPMSGETLGREAIAAGLYGNLATWFYLSFVPTIMRVDGDKATVQVQFEYQHQRTGLRLASTMRWVVIVTDELVRRVDCYHDSARVAAFMRLLRAHEGATGDVGVGDGELPCGRVDGDA